MIIINNNNVQRKSTIPMSYTIYNIQYYVYGYKIIGR